MRRTIWLLMAWLLTGCGNDETASNTQASTGSPAPNQFPISNATNSNQKPSAAERDRLVAWIDAGMPQ